MDFDIKLEGVDKALEMFDPNNVVNATTRAINDVAEQGMTGAKREITGEYNIKYSRLSQYLKLTTRAKGNNPEAVITGRGRGLSLSYFDAKQEGVMASKKGFRYTRRAVKAKGQLKYGGTAIHGGKVTVMVRKLGGRKEVVTDPKAFITQTKSGHIAVFQRIGKARIPLKELLGPGVGGLFGSKKIMDNTKRIINEKFKPRFEYWINYYLSRGK